MRWINLFSMFFKLRIAVCLCFMKEFSEFGFDSIFHFWFEQRPAWTAAIRPRSLLARRLVYSGSRLIITRPASRSLSPQHFAPPRAKTRSRLAGRHALFRESPIRSNRLLGRSSHYERPPKVTLADSIEKQNCIFRSFSN